MLRLAVVYWSGTGNTDRMATAVVQGGQEAGALVDKMTCDLFGPDKATAYDAIAFGCPAMGSEVLEEDEFQPMLEAVREACRGRKIGLFGSYGWGDGEWMQNWAEDMVAAGLPPALPYVIVNNEPEEEDLAACRDLGANLIRACQVSVREES